MPLKTAQRQFIATYACRALSPAQDDAMTFRVTLISLLYFIISASGISLAPFLTGAATMGARDMATYEWAISATTAYLPSPGRAY